MDPKPKLLRVQIWGINYAPEKTGIAVYTTMLAEHLQATPGISVEVLTGFPYYPSWRKEKKDQRCFSRREVIHQVPLQRSYLYVPTKINGWRRILHEASFVIPSWFRLLLKKRPDVLLVISPPLPLGVAARVYHWLRGVPYVLHVQDLQPDAAVGLGMLNPGLFTRFLYRMESFAYRGASRVSGISQGMLQAFSSKEVPVDKQIFFPNPVHLPHDLPDSTQRQASGLQLKNRLGWPQDCILLVYAGNIGVKQGLDQIIHALDDLPPETPLRFIICGHGADRERLEKIAAKSHRSDLLAWFPTLPDDEYRELMEATDLALITQLKGSGVAFFPSKLLTTTAFACPVLALADPASELFRAVEEGRLGWTVPSNEPEQLLAFLHRLPGIREEFKVRGENGCQWVRQFSRDSVLEDFVEELKGVIPGIQTN